MSIKNIILIVAVIIIISTIVGVGFFYLKASNKILGPGLPPLPPLPPTHTEAQIALIKNDPEVKAQQNIYNSQFPDVLRGTINIVSDVKTTLTTQDKKVYLISPARAMSFYGDSGIKNNDFVEIRGKLLPNGQLTLGLITKAK